MDRNSIPDSLPAWQREFLAQHRLGSSYLQLAQLWFEPLAVSLSAHQNSANDGAAGNVSRPILVAVNGCQGSGKTTVCDYLVASLQANHGLTALALSLDDFYLTREQRGKLATSVHPLLETRGVPGTHDMALLGRTLDALLSPTGTGPVLVPRFDKSVDDRRPQAEWDQVADGVDLILLEGWCMGARPQSATELAVAANELERNEDPTGSWRRYVNDTLERDFLPLYDRVNQWVMLQAPSFSCVQGWRLEQEQKLSDKTGGAGKGLMNADQVGHFIQYYQRITETCLARLPAAVDYLFKLDAQRQVTMGLCEGRVVK